MPDNREQLKNAVIERLDNECVPHPMGHQASKARRYVYKTNRGAAFEIMFEQNSAVPANLWVLESAVRAILNSQLVFRRSPSSSLYRKTGKSGDLLYGRHSSLERMPQLGKADLVCFNLQSVNHLGRDLEALGSAS